MDREQHDYVSGHYAPRASAYVASAVHSGGADLDQIETLVRGRASARVLDLGCGGGHVSYRVAPHVASVVACDLTADMLAEVSRTAASRGLANIEVRQAAAERLPFEADAFDIVLCRFTAHHWADMEAGLREARRVIATDGRAVFVDSVAPPSPLLDTHLQAIELLRDPSHVRNYTAAEWVAALARAGFDVTGITHRKLRMEFAIWTARTATPAVRQAAIEALQASASQPVRRHFAIGRDSSFDLDVVTIEAAPV